MRCGALVGPALAVTDSHDEFAAHFCVEVANPLSRRISLLGSGRVAYVPEG